MAKVDWPPRRPMHRRLAIALVVILALAAAPEALATIAGPCEATVAGEDILARDTFAKSDAISVPQTGGVPVTITAERPIDDLKLEIEFAGFQVHRARRANDRQAVDRGRPGRQLREGAQAVQDRRDGDRRRLHVWATALVDVQGNPLETTAGAIAVGMVVVGGLGGLLVPVKRRSPRARDAPRLLPRGSSSQAGSRSSCRSTACSTRRASHRSSFSQAVSR